ncbi:MAG TPA: hypothetical protein VJQ45_08070 [Ktedonobacterales bacterium]|nr:hypothetical protein [Ktedonobacterales bacterium]
MRGYTDHAVERAAERYGIVATDEEWEAAADAILTARRGERAAAVLMMRLNNGHAEHWGVRIGERAVIAVLLCKELRIVTILAPHQNGVAKKRPINRQTAWGRKRRDGTDRYRHRWDDDDAA